MTKAPHIKYESVGDRMRGLDLKLSNKCLAERLNCSPDTVRLNRRRLGYAPNASNWNEERIEALARLWADGLSASQIASRLGGLSRSAVIGKVHRLGLPYRVKPTGYGRKSTKHKSAERLTIPRKKVSPLAVLHKDGMPIPTPAEADIPRVSFEDLEPAKHCRFPCLDIVAGVPQDQPMFCGEKPEPGLPYCRAHALRAFNPPQPRQRESKFVLRQLQVA